jgi:hypothetical protein
MARPAAKKLQKNLTFFWGVGRARAYRVEVCGVVRSDTMLLGLTWMQIPVN